MIDCAGDPIACLEQALADERQEKMLALITDGQREIVEYDLAGWSDTEIVGFTGHNRPTIKARIYRARKTMRALGQAHGLLD